MSIVKTFTIDQLSKFFGVSITNIENWIRENRFVEVESKEISNQSRISENAIFKTSSNETIFVKEVIEMYNKQNHEDVSKEEEKKILESEIEFFEEKYDGKYEDALAKKIEKKNEEQRDESEWKYLLNRVK